MTEITVNLDDVDMTHDISEKPPEMEAEMIRFVVISDTHWKHHVMSIPEGDVTKNLDIIPVHKKNFQTYYIIGIRVSTGT